MRVRRRGGENANDIAKASPDIERSEARAWGHRALMRRVLSSCGDSRPARAPRARQQEVP